MRFDAIEGGFVVFPRRRQITNASADGAGDRGEGLGLGRRTLGGDDDITVIPRYCRRDFLAHFS